MKDRDRTPGKPAETGTAVAGGAGSPSHPFRPVIALMVLILLSLTATAGFKSYRDLDTARSYERDLLAKIAAARERVRILDDRIDRIRNDPTMLERLAREDLGLVKDGDVVIVLPDDHPPAQASPPVPASRPPAPPSP